MDDKIVKYLTKNYPPKTELESIIHGNLFFDQAQLLEDGEVYLFDFSDRSWAPVAQELAVFLNHLYRSDTITFERWKELKKWVLQAYQSVTELSTNDIKAIPTLMIKRIVSELSYLFRVSKELDIVVDEHGNKKRLEMANYLLTQSY